MVFGLCFGRSRTSERLHGCCDRYLTNIRWLSLSAGNEFTRSSCVSVSLKSPVSLNSAGNFTKPASAQFKIPLDVTSTGRRRHGPASCKSACELRPPIACRPPCLLYTSHSPQLTGRMSQGVTFAWACSQWWIKDSTRAGVSQNGRSAAVRVSDVYKRQLQRQFM